MLSSINSDYKNIKGVKELRTLLIEKDNEIQQLEARLNEVSRRLRANSSNDNNNARMKQLILNKYWNYKNISDTFLVKLNRSTKLKRKTILLDKIKTGDNGEKILYNKRVKLTEDGHRFSREVVKQNTLNDKEFLICRACFELNLDLLDTFKKFNECLIIRENNIHHHCSSKSCGYQIRREQYNTPINKYQGEYSVFEKMRQLFMPFRIFNLIRLDDGIYSVRGGVRQAEFPHKDEMTKILQFFHKSLPVIDFNDKGYENDQHDDHHRWTYDDDGNEDIDRWGFTYLYDMYKEKKENGSLETFLMTRENNTDNNNIIIDENNHDGNDDNEDEDDDNEDEDY